ncbi:N-acetyl sugar amidotransferase [Sulfuritortus calidifontis]|uniref:N-acetyl sugar amidotransferase n=1 Tax=Sulfuritortus calidifontis TaxID=1914471 RepID=A0A4R3JUE0_9PROT|nr:N-acetyl sugar amidotransferase [Sulfuritortus calidifontis]TCS70134.1 N-acetyl sugar amidotransferase [Sulfuritortus calidifontis]
MEYCSRCLYPANAKPTIIFDEEDGVCSGCNYHASRESRLANIDWDERERMFARICEEAKRLAKERGNPYDCIVPVSGGKDSHYQVWLLKERYGMTPLLVTFNHAFNSPIGDRNLANLVEKSGCEHIRQTAGLDSVRRLSLHMLKTVGDLTWHYHAGIRTLPFRVAVEKNIPLIVWGEHGFAELTGIVTLEDFVEFTKWTRKEHDMRGIEAHELIGKGGITASDIAPYVFPTDEEIERVGVRGIYMSNFFKWDAKFQVETVMRQWDFSPVSYERDRTFNLYAKVEDHANDVHDYLKFLKFGYGRATDDASMEIRHGRMTREEGIEQVRHYDAREPRTLAFYCELMGISVDEFYRIIEPMRDPAIWEKVNGDWRMKDAVYRHPIGAAEEAARVKQNVDRTFSPANQALYFNPLNPPLKRGFPAADEFPLRCQVL